MAARTCIISLATRNKRFPEALERLRESIERVGFAGEFLGWRPSDFPASAPSHRDIPFAFKPYCFEVARQQHFDLVLWMDSGCVAVRPLDKLFGAIDQHGYLLFRNSGYVVGEWASDAALAAFGLTRDEAMKLPEVNAAAIGLKLNSSIGLQFLEKWRQAADAGVPFRGVDQRSVEQDYLKIKWNKDKCVSADPRVHGHRHDQTVAGILASELGLNLTTHGIRPYSRQRPRISGWTTIVVDRDVSSAAPLTPLSHIAADMKIGYVKRVLNQLGLRGHAG